jgi:hypothetical protein
MASEIIEYRGYELHIEPYESGFKALENLDRFLIARNFPIRRIRRSESK